MGFCSTTIGLLYTIVVVLISSPSGFTPLTSIILAPKLKTAVKLTRSEEVL